MKNCFPASLCRQGVLGGWLLVEDAAVTFKTGKVTVPQAWRNLRLVQSEVVSMTPGRFSTVTFAMADGDSWTFLVFGRKWFLRLLQK